MKRVTFILTILAIFCILAGGCGQPSVEETTEVMRDLTISVENSCQPDSGQNILDFKSSTDSYLSPEFDSIVDGSDAIVRGTVKKVVFTQFDGVAWTKADMLVTDSLKGDFQKGDLISVFIPGGYISLADHIAAYDNAFRYENLTPKEIENTIIKDTVNGERFAQVGDDYIYCLVKTIEGSPLPDNAYERVSSYGQLAINNSGNYVQERFESGRVVSISPEKFKSYIK